MGNICEQACNCCECCNQEVKLPLQSKSTISVQKIDIQPKQQVSKVHYPQRSVHLADTYEVVTIQDYGEGPSPKIAKYSQMPKLTRQQINVLDRQRPSLKYDTGLTGTPLNCFFLTNKRIWYEGEWKQGLPHGRGKAYFQTGMYYEGTFNQGFAQSSDGIVVFPQGSYYRGNISQSKLNGKGVYYNAYNNLTYQGDWVNDKPQGYGVEEFRNGNRYEGQFKDGYKSGKGKFTWRSGMTYQGDFKMGYLWGNGRLKKGKGVFQGPFQRGMKVGQNISMNTDTGVFKGSLANGLMNGMGEFVWYDNKKYIGQFENGELHGTGMIEYPNGQKIGGTWAQGMNTGVDKISNKR